MKKKSPENLQNYVIKILNENKATNIKCYDTASSTIADYVIIATALSVKHASKLADSIIKELKENKLGSYTVEGKRISDWILLDIDKVIVQILVAEARQKYDLEALLESLNSKQLL